MPAPILATKLYLPPPRPGIVPRPRLVERLNAGLQAGRKLTLISASAGFGKTTLLSEWISSPHFFLREGAGMRAAWLSLDEGDSDPARFLGYFIAALKTIKAEIGESLLAALQTPQLPPIEAWLTALLNEIAAISDPFLLVLDDYHTVDSQAVDQAMAFWVDHQPPQMHLVIATRENPSLPLARLRVRGQLTEMRADDLRFTPAEAAEFLNRVMGLNLAAEDLATMEARTEGWVAGLQLAALSMQGQKDITSFIQSFTGSHHFVLDYLLEEVLQTQPERIQDFLLHTAILNRLCAPLCEAVVDEAGLSGQETLEALERANLFIISLDHERRWYRYHHLFGDLLRQRLGQSRTPAEISGSHLRASHWHEQNGDLAEAFHHALAARDFDRAAQLAEMAWQAMDDSFQTAAWLGWIKKLPDEMIGARPALCVQVGMAFMDAGKPEASESYLGRAERFLEGAVGPVETQPLLGMIAMARAYNAQVQGDLAAAVKYAERSLQLIPENDLYRRAQATITLEIVHWASGNLEASLRAICDWMDNMQKVGNLVFVVASAFAAADMQIALGRLREAEKTYRQAIQLATVEGRETEQVTAHHHLGLALLAQERGDDESAAQYLQKAAELGPQTTLVDWPYRWNLAQARLKESAGELDAALELLDEAKRVYVKNPVPCVRPVEALKARVYLKQGRLDRAQAWARERRLSPDDEVSYLGEFEYLTMARVLAAGHTFTGVSELLERLLAAAEGQKRTGSRLEILITQALVHQAQGQLSLALAALECALGLAEPEGYLRLFVDEGEPLRLLILDFRSEIEKQAGNGVHPLLGYLNKLRVAFPQSREADPKSKIENPNSEMIEPLSQRELEILRLVAQGLSNAEISQRLFVAVSTVKGHNLRIFEKLQVQNRTEAVARARSLGLL